MDATPGDQAAEADEDRSPELQLAKPPADIAVEPDGGDCPTHHDHQPARGPPAESRRGQQSFEWH